MMATSSSAGVGSNPPRHKTLAAKQFSLWRRGLPRLGVVALPETGQALSLHEFFLVTPPHYLGLLLFGRMAPSWPRPADEAALRLVHDGTFRSLSPVKVRCVQIRSAHIASALELD